MVRCTVSNISFPSFFFIIATTGEKTTLFITSLLSLYQKKYACVCRHIFQTFKSRFTFGLFSSAGGLKELFAGEQEI
ncbi:MAG: hypothetical protein IJN42_00695, partial [Clostridia bacterium]|nr:hypothetical protein [Clostridia bacterium]